MSALCQKRTHAPQQNGADWITLVGVGEPTWLTPHWPSAFTTRTWSAFATRRQFRPRVKALLVRLQKAAGMGSGRMSLSELDILAAASTELLTSTLANMPEPLRGERVWELPETTSADAAKKRERLEQKIPSRKLDTPKGSA